ncbi:GAF and ANTAR domain-containing protein [Streptomyces sp. NPDC060194]|uniref:GAF and ANTAR domain-containing protein n=1 Tax=Streptomyces sp. NPDC060194 TaxID=3347069 RepID=UPI003649A367
MPLSADAVASPAVFALAEILTSAATQLHAVEGHPSTLLAAVELAREIVPGAEYAGITVVERGLPARPVAWTDDIVRRACAPDEQGPDPRTYWDTLWDAPLVRTDETADGDGRGVFLGVHGLRSAISLRLRADQRKLSVLSLYARTTGAFGDADVRIGRLLAAHISIALETATEREQLTEAMRTRDVIGQATGLLMGRLDMDASEAFNRLVRTSQQENVKLRDIAQRIVDAVTPD